MASCTVLSLRCPSLVKETELQTQILQKINKPQNLRPGPILEKAKLHETRPSFCLLASPGWPSSLRRCTKLLGDDKHRD